MAGTVELLERCGGRITGFWREHPRGLFSEPFWADVFRNCYGLRPSVFIAGDPRRPAGLIPLVRVRGKFCSLPFLDYSAPVCPEGTEDAVAAAFTAYLCATGDRAHLRSLSFLPALGLPVHTGAVTMRLALPATGDAAWKGFDAKVRNQVRKPEKNGVTVREGDEGLSAFYRIWAAHISGLGTPVHPERFFKGVLDALPAERRTVVTAWLDGTAVGGLLMLYDDDTAYVPWAAGMLQHRSLCISHALYWYALRRAIGDGKTVFDFLRSRPGGGTYRFKKQWGAEEVPLYYYDTDGPGNPHGGTGFRLASAVWKRLPVPVAVRLGPLVRRYVP